MKGYGRITGFIRSSRDNGGKRFIPFDSVPRQLNKQVSVLQRSSSRLVLTDPKDCRSGSYCETSSLHIKYRLIRNLQHEITSPVFPIKTCEQ